MKEWMGDLNYLFKKWMEMSKVITQSSVTDKAYAKLPKELVPSIRLNRNGRVNRNTHKKNSSDLNFSKLKNHMNSLVHTQFR